MQGPGVFRPIFLVACAEYRRDMQDPSRRGLGDIEIAKSDCPKGCMCFSQVSADLLIYPVPS